MARYRIGNDITIIWTVNDRNGAALPLADKDVRLFYTCERGRYQAEITIQDTNKVVWDFSGGLQKVLGGYSLTLEILQSDGKRSIKKDVCNAFLLVAKDCEADAKETTTNGELAVYQEQITTNLDIARISPIIPVIVEDENGVGYWYVDGVNTGDRATGESAYDYAKQKGYEGTEDEFAEQMAGLGQGWSVDIVNTTYEEIVNLRNDNNLIKGCPYRITDYVTTTAKEYTQSAGHPFDIIVFAITGNALSENAMCALHEGDEYFAESNIESWKIKYCLDNDTSRFDWADTENGKGVIYWMEDQNRNFAPYDFKNLLVYGETLRGRSQSVLSNCPIPIDNRSLTIIGSSYYYMFSSLDGTVDRSLKGSYIQNSGFKVTGASDDIQYLSPSAILCPENYAILSFQVDYGFWSGIVLTSASDLTDDGSVAVSIKNLTNSIIVTSRMNYFTANAIANSYIDVGIQLTGMDLGVISNSAISTQYFQSCAISMLSNSYIQMTTAIDSMVIKGRGTDLVFAGGQLSQIEFSLVKGFEYIGEPSEKIGNFYSDCHFITVHSDGSRMDMKEFLLPMKSYSQRLYYKYGGTIASMYEYDYVAASSLATINGKRIDEGGNIEIEGGASIEVDSNLSATSENPVQNKVVTASLANKLESDIVASTEPTDDIQFGYDDTEIRQEIADLSAEIGKKQDTITDLAAIRSGAAKGATAIQSVKTINGESIVGEGDITIVGGEKGEKGDKGDKGDQGNSGYTGAADELEVVNNLTQGGATAALSAEMGKELGEKSAELTKQIEGKPQETIQWQNNGYYGIPSSVTEGTVISTVVNTQAIYSSAIVECEEGDRFLFTGRASSFRPVAFLDAENKLLSGYGEFGIKYKDAEFVAPADSAKVILQVQTSEWTELGGALPVRLAVVGLKEMAHKADSAVLTTPADYTSQESVQAFSNLKVGAIALNNILAEGNFANPSAWSLSDTSSFSSLTIKDGYAKVDYSGVVSSRNLRCTSNYTIPANSKVFFLIRYKTNVASIFPSIAFSGPDGFTRLTDAVSLNPNSDWATRVFECDYNKETKLSYLDLGFSSSKNTKSGDSISYKDVNICVIPNDTSISFDEYSHLMREQKWFYGEIVIPDYKRLIALDKNLAKDIKVTVGEGGDFDTITAALEYLSEYHTIYKYGGFNAEICILNGTIIKEQILVVAADFSWVTITYEGYNPESLTYDNVAESIANGTIVFDETEGYNAVKVDASGWPSTGVTHDTRGDVCLFRAEEGGDLPRINCVFKLIKAGSYGTAGICCNRGSSAVVKTLCGFIGFKDGVISNNESSIVIREGITMNCARWGCHARHNGEVSARSIIATGCAYDSTTDGENGALVCDRIADLDGREGWVSAGTTIFRIANASRMNCNGTHVVGDASAISTIVAQSLSLGNFVQMSVVGKLKVYYAEGAMLTLDTYDMEGEYTYNAISKYGIIYRD